MTTFLRVLQEAGQHEAEVVQQGVEHAAEGGVPDIGGMLIHHLADAKEIELPWGTWVLPHWEPIHLGGLTIDFSPTKHVVFMALAAVIVCALFLTVARALKGKYEGQAPSGMANAMEAMKIFGFASLRSCGVRSPAQTPQHLLSPKPIFSRSVLTTPTA